MKNEREPWTHPIGDKRFATGVSTDSFFGKTKPYASYDRPLPRRKNGGIRTMQVVYKTCLTRIEREKKVAGKASSPTAYNSIPAPVPPSAPLRPLLAPRGPRRAVCDRTRPRALYPD